MLSALALALFAHAACASDTRPVNPNPNPSATSTSQNATAATRTQLAHVFQTEAREEAFIAAVLARRFGPNLPPDKRHVAQAEYLKLIGDPALQNFLLDAAIPLLQAKASRAELGAAMADAMLPLTLNGLGRLPPDTKRQFLRYMIQLTRGMPAAACHVGNDALSRQEVADLELQWLIQQPLAEFSFVLRTYSDAAMAELQRTPVFAAPSPEQDAQANAHLKQAIDMLMAKRLTPEALERVMAGKRQGREACIFTETMLEAMSSLPDPYFSWSVRTVFKAQ